jgi:DNA primase
MAKLAQNFAKYVIQARMSATGIVEKPDVIGAVFGQTEGLLGTDLDLRELQRTGRIGRIEVMVRQSRGQAMADIIIPSSLDASETALVAASLETIEKVGPCDAKIEVAKVEDVRSQKRKYVIDRAKDLLRKLMESTSDNQNIADHIRESVRTFEVQTWNGLSCGPDVQTSEEITVVEGRADVINLLKAGIRNAIAIEGSKIPQAIVDLCKQKTVTAMLDGDRGGDLILKKLMTVTDIDFVARAEAGLEVEDLSQKQIFKSLRERVTIDQIKAHPELGSFEGNGQAAPAGIEPAAPSPVAVAETSQLKQEMLKLHQTLLGTRAAYLLDADNQIVAKLPIGEIGLLVGDYPETTGLVADSKISQDLVDLCLQRRIRTLVGSGYRESVRSSADITIFVPEATVAA